MNKTKLKKLIKEVYYGSIPPEPELPVGYGDAVDRAKVQRHLSDVIDDLVRSGKLNLDDLSIETVRANQEIPWDKFQAIDDVVLRDIIYDFQRKKGIKWSQRIKQVNEIKKKITNQRLKQIIREELKASGDYPDVINETLFRTPEGSELEVVSVNYHPYTAAGKIIDSVDFEVKSIAEKDITGYQAFFYERPEVGEQINIISSDLPMIGWNSSKKGANENKRHIKQIIREELTMRTNEDDLFEFYRDLYKDLYGRNPDEYPSDENLQAEIDTLLGQEKSAVEQDKYRAEMDAATAMPPDAGTEKPLPPKFSGMGRRIKENKAIKQLVKETIESALNERDYNWSERSMTRKFYGKPEAALEEIKRLVDEVLSTLNTDDYQSDQ